MKTIACIATVEGREKLLNNTIKSLKGQVDEIFVIYRGTRLISTDVNYEIHDNSKGDAAKFYKYCQDKNYSDVWFFCDDDLLYPSDYIEKSLKHLEKYPKSILSYHGRTIKLRPVESYYRFSRIQSFRCLHEVNNYEHIGVNGTLGTGVMFFNSGVIELNYEDFKYPNMADIWMAKFAIEKGVKMVVCPHKADWIIDQDPYGYISQGIFREHQFSDELQTKVYNSIKL